MQKYFTILLLVLFAFPERNTAQDNIAAGVDISGNGIVVKWFDSQVIYPYGIHIYREEEGNGDWKKITSKPIKKGDYAVPSEIIRQDTAMQEYIDIVKDARPRDLEGIAGAIIVIKAIQSNEYARYLGICYFDIDIEQGKSYRYRVVKLNAQGRESRLAETQPVTAGAFVPLAPPAGLEIKAKDSKADIKWQPEPLRYFGVNIYRSSDREPEPVKLNNEPMLISDRTDDEGKTGYPDIFFTDEPLENYLRYTYYLKGIDYLGFETLAGEPLTIEPLDQTPPEPPVEFKAEADGMRIHLNWENFNPSPDMEGYRVYRSTRLNQGYSTVNNELLSNETKSFTDAVPDPGEYFYYVASVDRAGNEGFSFKEFVNVEDVYAPAAPRGLTAQADSGKITLRWIPNTEKDLAGYQVFRTVEKDKNMSYALLNAAPLKDTVFVDKLPFNAKNRFYYKVAAIDSSLNRSIYSEPIFDVMPDLVPPARPFIKTVTQQENSLLIEWIPNTESDLNRYDIYRLQENDTIGERLNIKPITGDISRYTDYLVQPGVAYRYYLTATDSANNISSPSQYHFAVFLPDEADEPETANPLNDFRITYRPGQKQATLKWRLRDMPGLKGVMVFRKENGNRAFTPLTGLIKTEREHPDKTIREGKEYSYRLHLFFESGEVIKSEEIKVNIKNKK